MLKNRLAVLLSSQRFIAWSVSLCSGHNTRYMSNPQGSTCCGRGTSGCCLGWSVGSAGFPLRHTHGRPGDRFLPIEMFLDHVRAGSRKIEVLPNDLRISV